MIWMILSEKKVKSPMHLYTNNVRFIPGFIQFHRQLATYNLKSGIATNASAETAALTDKILNLASSFLGNIFTMFRMLILPTNLIRHFIYLRHKNCASTHSTASLSKIVLMELRQQNMQACIA